MNAAVGVAQGGVAGGVPPHKGGPQARPPKSFQSDVFPSLPEDESRTNYGSDPQA